MICIRKYYDIKISDFYYLKPGKNYTELDDLFDKYFPKEDRNVFLEEYNFDFYNYCEGENSCTRELKNLIGEKELTIDPQIIYKNMTLTFYYSCKDKNKKDFEEEYRLEGGDFEGEIIFISLISLIVIIIFYYLYRYGIFSDNKESQKKQIFINNYTLVLHNLKIISEDYNQEISDLISFLNKIILNYKHIIMPNFENYKELNTLNVFEISISHVNNKKIDVFKKIKSLENNIRDIENDNDTLKNKLKNNIKEIYHSMENFVVNLTDKEKKDKSDENEKNIIDDKTSSESDEGYNLEKQIKIGKKKTEINEKKNDIIIDIIQLHKENNLNKYVNIYITFRSQVIPNLIYDLYNKNKVIRFFYFIFCQRKKIKKY